MEAERVQGIPVTTPERTLLDCASILPAIVVAKAVESAIRKRLTTTDRINEVLAAKGGRGVRGTRKLRWIVSQRVADTATGRAPSKVRWSAWFISRPSRALRLSSRSDHASVPGRRCCCC